MSDFDSCHRLELKIKRSGEIGGSERGEIIEFLSEAYREDFRPILASLPDLTHVLGYHHGELVAHGGWVTRWLECPNRLRLRTAYVEAIATGENHRRQGCARAVMQRIAEEIQEFDLGALSPAVTGLYISLGWQLWRGPLFIRSNAGLIATPDEQVMVLLLPKTPRLDLDWPLTAEWREGELW